MADFPPLFVLRHGETEWNLAGRFQGRNDSPLTDKGRAQAAQQRRILAGLDDAPSVALVSPQGRAAATARIALPQGVETRHDARLQEVDIGDWEGQTRAHIKSEIDYPYESYEWHFRSPNGETFDEMAARVGAVLAELTAPTIIVTHGVTSTVLRGLWLGLDRTALLQLPREQGCVVHLANGRETTLR